MDGYTFVFEAVDVIAGNWMGVYKAEDEGEQERKRQTAPKEECPPPNTAAEAAAAMGYNLLDMPPAEFRWK